MAIYSFPCAVFHDSMCNNNHNSKTHDFTVPKWCVSPVEFLVLRTSRFCFFRQAQVNWGSKGALIPTLAQPVWHMFHITLSGCVIPCCPWGTLKLQKSVIHTVPWFVSSSTYINSIGILSNENLFTYLKVLPFLSGTLAVYAFYIFKDCSVKKYCVYTIVIKIEQTSCDSFIN